MNGKKLVAPTAAMDEKEINKPIIVSGCIR